MKNITEKLLPCPFCGCDRPTLQPEYEANNRFRIRYWVIRCERCLTQMDRVTKALTIAAWNRRVAEEQQWTKETPTEPGWYWFRYLPEQVEHAVVAIYSTEEDPDRLRIGLYCRTGIEMQGEDFCYLDKFIAKEEKKQRGLPLWRKIPVPALLEGGENDA